MVSLLCELSCVLSNLRFGKKLLNNPHNHKCKASYGHALFNVFGEKNTK